MWKWTVFRSNKARLILWGSLTLWAVQALPFQKDQPFTIGDPRQAARESGKSNSDLKKPDLAPTRLELITKNNLISMKFKDPKKFNEVKQNHLENSLLYQSWVDEVDEALSERPLPKKIVLKKDETLVGKFFEGTRIDIAKKIAKKQMFLALQRNWPWLKDTIFNEFGSSEWRHGTAVRADAAAPISSEGPSGADLTVDKLNELFRYSPKHSNSAVYDFDFDFGGRNFVEINRKTLNRGRVGLDINSEHDVNRLEPGAEKIQADSSEVPSSGGGDSAPVAPSGGSSQPDGGLQ